MLNKEKSFLLVLHHPTRVHTQLGWYSRNLDRHVKIHETNGRIRVTGLSDVDLGSQVVLRRKNTCTFFLSREKNPMTGTQVGVTNRTRMGVATGTL